MASVSNISSSDPFPVFTDDLISILSMLPLADQKAASLVNKDFNDLVGRIASWQHMKKEKGVEDESERILEEVNERIESSGGLTSEIEDFIEKIASRMIKAQVYWFLSYLFGVKGDYVKALDLIIDHIPEGLISFHRKSSSILTFRWRTGTIKANALATLTEVALTKGDIKSANLFVDSIATSLDDSLKTQLRSRISQAKEVFKFIDEEFEKEEGKADFQELLQKALEMELKIHPDVSEKSISRVIVPNLVKFGPFQKAATEAEISSDDNPAELEVKELANAILCHAGSMILARAGLI